MKRSPTIRGAESLGSRITPLGSNADLESQSEYDPGTIAQRAKELKQRQQKIEEAKDPDQMHLLKPLTFNMDELDQQMFEVEDFNITIDRRRVNELMDLYEEKNTRMLIDVNTGEDDIVQENEMTVFTDVNQLETKLNQVKDTIQILKAREIEQNQKFEYLNAPKREAKKS